MPRRLPAPEKLRDRRRGVCSAEGRRDQEGAEPGCADAVVHPTQEGKRRRPATVVGNDRQRVRRRPWPDGRCRRPQ